MTLFWHHLGHRRDRRARRRVLLRLGGVQDGSVSTFNIVLWAGILAGLGLIVFGSRALHRNGHRGLATLLAAVPAIPALLYGLLIVAMMFSGARWN